MEISVVFLGLSWEGDQQFFYFVLVDIMPKWDDPTFGIHLVRQQKGTKQC